MNCIYVVNVNGCLCANSQRSLQSAARRWQVDYVELIENGQPDLHPAFSKCGGLLGLNSFHRVACFDADMLIRSDAPSPFDCLDDANRLYVVRDLARVRPYTPKALAYDLVGSVRGSFYADTAKLVGQDVEYGQYLRGFFNSGFFVASPERHRALFECIVSHFPPGSHPMAKNVHFEQALFNYVVQATDPDVLSYAPETWNFIDPDIRQQRMDAFVYHFTGANFRELKQAIYAFPWTVQ